MKPEDRVKTIVRACAACGHVFQASKDQCPSCRTWNRGVEKKPLVDGDGTKKFTEGRQRALEKIQTGIADEILSKGEGGFVTTGVYLIGGTPGAGKSTISLQWLERISLRTQREGLYVGLEEDEDETIDRARGLGLDLSCMRIYPMGCEADLFEVIARYKSSAIIIDSIVKVAGENPADAIKVCGVLKKDVASKNRSPVIIISHVNKDEAIAGLQALQHEVDWTGTIFPIEELRKSKRDEPPREMQSYKNRFGRTGYARFDMTDTGLIEIPVPDDDESNSVITEEGDHEKG